MRAGWVQAGCPLLSQAVPAIHAALLGGGEKTGWFPPPTPIIAIFFLVEQKSRLFLSLAAICLLRQGKAEPGSCGPGQLLGPVAGS